MDSARETSGVTTRLIVRYVRARAGDAAVERVLERAAMGRTAAELEDESNWFSYADKIALFRAAAAELDEPLVSRDIGETVLDERVGVGVRVLLRALGSPGKVLQNISRTAPKFSAACTMETHGVSNNHATVTYKVAPGLTADVLDCEYKIGLLSQVTCLFGMPAARIDHDICQARGAERCVYSVSWRARRSGLRGKRRIAFLEDQLRTLAERADALQSNVADIVSIDDPDTVLRRIASRAAGAVGARGHVLAVRTGEGEELRIIAEGIGAHRAERMATRLVEGRPEDADAPLLVAEVKSSRRDYGVLIAVPAQGQEFFDEERPLFATYARQAAVALDVSLALGESREREQRLVEASRELDHKEQRYRSLFVNNTDAVFSLDLTGHLEELNPACGRITGYSIEELAGMHFLPLLGEDSVAPASQVFAEALEGRGQDFEFTIRHRDGHRLRIMGTSFPIVVDGEITGVYGMAREVPGTSRPVADVVDVTSN